MATKTSGVSQMVISRVLCLAPVLAAIGCGAGFDSPDWVKSLRVVGVRKDHPYAAPTDPANPSQVNLTMLDYDGTQGYTVKPRIIQRLWFSGCDDLPGDQYFTCLVRMYGLWQFYITAHPGETYPGKTLQDQEGSSWSPGDPDANLTDDQVYGIVQTVNTRIPQSLARAYLSTYRIGSGSYFTYPVPPLIIDNHQASSEPNIPAFGLSFIFFTVCAGHIDVAPEWQGLNIGDTLHNAVLGFPFICVDNNKNTLGPDDFVSGYTQLFVYGDGTANYNPIIEGASFDNQDADAEDYCIDAVCVPLTAPNSSAPDPCVGPSQLQHVRHVPACSGNCPAYEFSPTMKPKDNNDVDVFQSKEKDSPVGEQMWVDYYTDRGTLNHAVKLLRDASAGRSDDGTLGWSDNHSDTWTAPSDAGPVNLWAVAHDNRGGTSWVRLLICVD